MKKRTPAPYCGWSQHYWKKLETNKESSYVNDASKLLFFLSYLYYTVIWNWIARSVLSLEAQYIFIYVQSWTYGLLIKSYLNSVCLSLTDSKVIKLLKRVMGKIAVSRLKQERLIKWPLLLFTSSKSAFFYSRQASVRECGFFSVLLKISFFSEGKKNILSRLFLL